MCVHLGFDIVHTLGKGTDLRCYRNYIIGQLPLSCILMQVLEASPTPLIPWDLSSPLHDKCIWTQSVCNGFLLQERYRPRARPDQRCTHFPLQRDVRDTVCLCKRKKRMCAKIRYCVQSVSQSQTYQTMIQNHVTNSLVVNTQH